LKRGEGWRHSPTHSESQHWLVKSLQLDALTTKLPENELLLPFGEEGKWPSVWSESSGEQEKPFSL